MSEAAAQVTTSNEFLTTGETLFADYPLKWPTSHQRRLRLVAKKLNSPNTKCQGSWHFAKSMQVKHHSRVRGLWDRST